LLAEGAGVAVGAGVDGGVAAGAGGRKWWWFDGGGVASAVAGLAAAGAAVEPSVAGRDRALAGQAAGCRHGCVTRRGRGRGVRHRRGSWWW
jgi:hypothetical protein